MVNFLSLLILLSATVRGRVIDGITGSPIYYVQVYLKEIKRGTTTDANGYFVIENVPDGIYTLSASYLGYEPYEEKVNVKAGVRKFYIIKLKRTYIYTQPIEITSVPLEFRKDVTPSVYSIPSEDLLSLPVDNYEDVVKIQPGVAAGHIRGGRLGEVLYLVDGLPITEPIHGGPATDLPNYAIVEMTVYTGGFEAEYGNAMSGVVNLVTKKRVKKPFFFTEIKGDYAGKPLPSKDVSSYANKWHFQTAFGTKFFKKLNWFLSADYRVTDTRFHRDFYNFFKKPIKFNFNFTGNVTYDFSSSRSLTLQGLYSYSEEHPYEYRWRYNLKGLPKRRKGSYRLGLYYTDAPFSGFFYELKLSNYWILAQALGKNSREYDPNVEFDSLGFVVSGDKPWWQDHEENILTFKCNFNLLLKDIHSIKWGGEFTYYDLYLNNVILKDISYLQPQNPNSYYIAYVTEYNYYPYEGAFFVQDKIRFPTMTVDLGLRYDFMNPRATRPAIERNPMESEEEWIVKMKDRVPASVKHQVSPRFGMAFQATDQDVIRINYGHFFQVPLFEYLYTNIDYDLSSGYPPLVGDPDLKASRTVAFEVGYKHWFNENFLVSFTVFSKDVSNLVDTKRYLPDTAQSTAPVEGGYTKFANIGMATIYGFEFLLEKIKGENWSGSLSYTLMYAKGTIGAFGFTSDEEMRYWEGVRVEPGRFYYLSWDQRHTLVADIMIGKEEGRFIDFLIKWNSPLPYTKVNGDPNGERMSSTFYWDIKSVFPLLKGKGKLSLLFEVRNLPDRRNLLWVDGHGVPGGRLHDPTAWDEGRRVIVGFWGKF